MSPRPDSTRRSFLVDTDRVHIRPTTVDDAPLIRSVHASMSADDLRMRFFATLRPDDDWYRSWASIGERGGFGVIALVDERAVGEAGYVMRTDGDADLAVAVATDWRGGLGTVLLDTILAHAAEAGLGSLHADVMGENRAMHGLVSKRGAVYLEHDCGTTSSMIATDGGVPSWPPDDDRPRVLVEVASGRWSGERAAIDAGWNVATCGGPERRQGGCPELHGDRCPLVEGADAVVVLLDPAAETTETLVEVHRESSPDTPLYIRPSGG